MEKFNKIRIISENEDIDIESGNELAIFYGRYDVENGCLTIVAYEDVTVVLPGKHYQEISITTINGDCSIELAGTCVDKIAFSSHYGDLDVTARCNNIEFKSINGELSQSSFNRSTIQSDISGKEIY